MNYELRNRGWDEMKALLDKQKRKPTPIFIVLPYAASIAALIIAGFVFLQKGSNPYFWHEQEAMQIRNLPDINGYQSDDIGGSTELLANAKIPNETTDRLQQPYNHFADAQLIASGLDIDKELAKNRAEITTPIFQEESISYTPVYNQPSNNNNQVEQENKTKSTSILFQNNDDLPVETFASNQIEEEYTIMSSAEINKTFNQVPIDLSFNTHGSIGFVSQNGEDYGLRVGLELEKPINNRLSVNSGIRYSKYADRYDSTYEVGETSYSGTSIIENLDSRDVRRSFVEVPIYAEYSVTPNVKLKAGGAVTYNTNKSDEVNDISRLLVTSSAISDDLLQDAGSRLGDRHGYLGEAVLGATIEVDRIALDFEATHGLISNQNIEGRSVVGVRLSYQLGKKN